MTKLKFLHSFRSRWRGLTVQLFAFIIIPLAVLLLTISFGSVLLHQSAMRTLVGERDLRAVQTASRAISEQLHHRVTVAKVLLNRAEDGTELQNILNSSIFLLQDFKVGLAFFDREGKMLAFEGDKSFWENLEYSAYPILIESMSMAKQDAVFSQPFAHSDYEFPLIFVIVSNPTEDLYIAGAISPGEIALDSIGEVFPGEDMDTAILAGSNRQIIFHQGNSSSLNSPGKRTEILDQLEGQNGVLYYEDGGDELVLAYSSISSTDWVLLLEESWASLASPILRTTEVAPLVLAPIVIFAILALWFGTRQIIAPLQTLETRAAALAWGDFEAVKEEVSGITEIESLQRTLIHMASKVRKSQQSMRGYIGAITKGQEEERQRLARELHDVTIQSLIALNQKVQIAKMSLSDSAIDPTLSEISEMIEENIKGVRQLTRDLRPSYLEDLGLSAALEMLVQETSQLSGIDIRFAKEGREERLEPEIELTLYRIAQEGLSNVMRHSRSEKANIHLQFLKEEIRMIISDNGQGFFIPEKPVEFASEGHYGLLGIHDRVELINARLNIQSEQGIGTSIEITIPQKLKKTKDK